ncbi:kinesin-domain-containing protein, partial [Rozella allomycis CSF55]
MDNIKTFLRIRPFNALEIERKEDNFQSIAVKIDEQTVQFKGQKLDMFSYDHVGDQMTTQEEVFKVVGKVMCDHCLEGYNATIFAYGQTSSGKSFTINGPTNEEGNLILEHRGLIPRILDYLFENMERMTTENEVEFVCNCSYVEIYNEVVYDLLDPSGQSCTLREDIRRGVCISGNTEEEVHSSQEAYRLFLKGIQNRHVAETAMNRESSRSHSLFTITIFSKTREGGILNIAESRFNIVDLAGSERQSLTGATGIRLKEAGNINKSLLALGNVINSLLDIAMGRPRHVHYRDSKLTFLLRDSLGGNSKTFVIANVSPSSACVAETLSTLRFAQRVKQIRNKAIKNKDVVGDVDELQAEIKRLKDELNKRIDYEVDGNSSEFVKFVMEQAQLFEEKNQEISKFQKRVEQLEKVLKAFEERRSNDRMLLNLKEENIRKMRDKISALEERELYEREIELLRKSRESETDVNMISYQKFILEQDNKSLIRKLAKYQVMQQREEEEIKIRNDFFSEISEIIKENLKNEKIEIRERKEENEIEELQKKIEEIERMRNNERMEFEEEKKSLEGRIEYYKREAERQDEDKEENVKELKQKLENLERKSRRMSDFAFESQAISQERFHDLITKNKELINQLKSTESKHHELIDENENLSLKIVNLEKKMGNILNENSRLDFQILKFKEEIKNQQEENENLKAELQNLNLENEQLYAKISTLNLEKESAMSDLFQSMLKKENSSKIQDDDEKNRFEEKINEKEIELEKIKNILKEKEYEIARVEKTLSDLQGEMQKTKIEHFNLQEQFNENEKELKETKSELGKTKDELHQSLNELFESKQELSKRETKIQKIQNDFENLQIKFQEFNKNKEKLLQLEEINKKLTNDLSKVQGLADLKIEKVRGALYDAQKSLKEKELELNKTQLKLNDTQNQLQLTLNNLSMKNSELESKLNELSHFKEEYISLQSKLESEFKIKEDLLMEKLEISEIENQKKTQELESLKHQFERLNKLLKSQNDKIENFKEKISQLEFHLSNAQEDNENLLNQLQSLQDSEMALKLEENASLMQKLKMEIDKLENEKLLYKQEYDRMAQENQQFFQHQNPKQKIKY